MPRDAPVTRATLPARSVIAMPPFPSTEPRRSTSGAHQERTTHRVLIARWGPVPAPKPYPSRSWSSRATPPWGKPPTGAPAPLPILLAEGSPRTGRSDGGDEEVGHLVPDSDDIRQEADIHEPGSLDGRLPLLGREESATGTVERMKPRRSERLRQVEDELGIDRLPPAGAHALGRDEIGR